LTTWLFNATIYVTTNKFEDRLENIVGRLLAEQKLTLATAGSG